MGKSQVEILPRGNLNLKMPKQGDLSMCMPDLQNNMENNISCSNYVLNDMIMHPNQVSGHMNDGKHVGMIGCNGKILKPIAKENCFERETQFYESLQSTEDETLLELKHHAPRYYGNHTITLGEKKIECIVMDDLTKDLKEPCIMDVKIGRRTWDPTASYDKIMKEEQKYHQTKKDLGFCITGFQVYKISSGKMVKVGKEYGKNLDKDSVVDAFRAFLNAEVGLSRHLLVQLLASLWRIQNWARKQRKLRLYSSSILIMYDGRKLKQSLGENSVPNKPPSPQTKAPLARTNSLYRPMSLAVLNGDASGRIPTGFSGQLTKEGPILKSPVSPRLGPVPQPATAAEKKERKHSSTTVPTLKRVHSFHNNFDKDLQTLKRDYTYMLDDLVSEQTNDLWVSVKIIDFAHAFPATNNEVDSNYLEGVENLVKIFEGFLKETDYVA